MATVSGDSPPGPARSPAAQKAHAALQAGSAATMGEAVSGASRRLRALAALSGSLTDALGPAEAADLVEQKALSALGATSAVVVTLGAFPPAPSSIAAASDAATLHVVHAIGLPEEVRAALDELPLDAPIPSAQVCFKAVVTRDVGRDEIRVLRVSR